MYNIHVGRSVGEVERRASRSKMRRLVKWSVMFGMWCFMEEIKILWNWKDSSASRVNESQSAFLRLVKV